LLSKLTDVHGKIQIPGLDKLVAPVTPEEEKLYETIDFDLVRFKKLIPDLSNL
jgi:Cys-Gly metallodipeptidase DUG1